MAILSANTNPKLQEERQGTENAKATLGALGLGCVKTRKNEKRRE